MFLCDDSHSQRRTDHCAAHGMFNMSIATWDYAVQKLLITCGLYIPTAAIGTVPS